MLELSEAARAHFEHPRHVGALDADAPDVAMARVGEPVSGAILQLHLRIGAEGSITAARFKAYGCGWLIACGSLLAERLQGRTLERAARLRHYELVETLDVPPEKLYCAVLAETALKKALRAGPTQPTPPVAVQSDHL
ncbi:MAG: iron-sulfur cluster assembly scaffold protein [Candidatus Contendobacter sp.]|nr:iron-sulfur cluster assembly scaffold protein [Candidatus Contendobacter sp.]MDG4559454.1 iron-sulfur cluster assembly scaffold protein [Candidatus Contendobacter sp.]